MFQTGTMNQEQTQLLDPSARRRRSSGFLRVLASCFLWVAVPVSLISAFLLQVTACVLLWPVFLCRPSFKIWLLGFIMRSCVTTAAFFLNPFWRLRRVRSPATPPRLNGRTLIVCNHLTQADPWIFSRALWPWEFKWVYKSDLLKIPLVGSILRMSYDIPLHFTKERGGWGTQKGEVKAMMDKVEQMGVAHGIGTVVFPEGTRSKSGRLQPFKEGFFRFAIERGWAIVPCVAHNSQALWPLGSLLFGYGTVYFSMGDPMFPQPGDSPESLAQRVRDYMADMIREMPLYDPETDEPMPGNADVVERGHGIFSNAAATSQAKS